MSLLMSGITLKGIQFLTALLKCLLVLVCGFNLNKNGNVVCVTNKRDGLLTLNATEEHQ